MAHYEITKGLDLPIAGAPELSVEAARRPQHVALIADDYIGMKPSLFVKVGDQVKRGQKLFEDKKTPGVFHTAPAAGEVVGIHRGERRAFQSIVIALSESEAAGKDDADDAVSFETYHGKDVDILSTSEVRGLLTESGLWTALRKRPLSRVPSPDACPHSIFINAMDTNPLAPPVAAILEGRDRELSTGIKVVSKLTQGRLYICKDEKTKLVPPTSAKAHVESFSGPHPAGNVGTHIHFIDPVGLNKVVWHLNIQDVIAIGHLFLHGTLDVNRIVSLAGPGVRRPRLLRTRIGTSLDDLCSGELAEGEQRVVSGSVLSGRAATGPVHGYLGRYHQQVSVLPEDREQRFLGWLEPGAEKFSMTRLFLSVFSSDKKYNMSTTTNGSHRAIVPIGQYERVMPLDILPTFLLRALASNDIERAQQLGCLELDEEDLALCTYVDPGKHDFGTILRRNLDIIEKEEMA